MQDVHFPSALFKISRGKLYHVNPEGASSLLVQREFSRPSSRTLQSAALWRRNIAQKAPFDANRRKINRKITWSWPLSASRCSGLIPRDIAGWVEHCIRGKQSVKSDVGGVKLTMDSINIVSSCFENEKR